MIEASEKKDKQTCVEEKIFAYESQFLERKIGLAKINASRSHQYKYINNISGKKIPMCASSRLLSVCSTAQ